MKYIIIAMLVSTIISLATVRGPVLAGVDGQSQTIQCQSMPELRSYDANGDLTYKHTWLMADLGTEYPSGRVEICGIDEEVLCDEPEDRCEYTTGIGPVIDCQGARVLRDTNNRHWVRCGYIGKNDLDGDGVFEVSVERNTNAYVIVTN